MTLRVLVTGSCGQLGTEILRCLATMEAEAGSIPPDYQNASVQAVDLPELDVADSDSVEKILAPFNPDIVFNCAAMTDVDGCEEDEQQAFRVNATGPANLARTCNSLSAKLVHVSTDYVFAGDDSRPRVETDPTGPVSAYGRSKLVGEEAALAANPRTFIVRTAWLYGYKGHNFVKTMCRLGSNRDSVMVVDDQLGNPTSANDLAYMLLRLALTENYGVYHCANNGACSWADFAQAIMDGLKLDCEVIRVTSEHYKAMNPQCAARPAYSSLDNKHFQETIGDAMRPWQIALASYLEHLPSLER